MLLNSATQKIVAVLTSAKTTYDMPITVNYADTVATPFSFVGVPVYSYTSGLTAVDLVTGAVGTQRSIKKFAVYGRDTTAKGFRLGVVDFTAPIVAGSFVAGRPYQITATGSTDFTLVGAANSTPGTIFDATGVGAGTGTASPFYQEIDMVLQVDDTLCYTDVQGWYTVDSQGNLKSVQAASATAMATAIHGATAKTVLVGADEFTFWDSVTGLLNKITQTNFWAQLSGLYASTTSVTGLITIASATATDIFGAAGATISIDNSTPVTTTSFTDCTSAQVGSVKRVIPVQAWSVTASANLVVDGATSGTFVMPAGAKLEVLADTTTKFDLTTIYATGTWIPSVGGTATYSLQAGAWTKRGRDVTVDYVLVITAIGTGSTTTLSGLPFTSANNSQLSKGVSTGVNCATSVVSENLYVNSNATTIAFEGRTAANISVAGLTYFGSGSASRGSVTYKV